MCKHVSFGDVAEGENVEDTVRRALMQTHSRHRAWLRRSTCPLATKTSWRPRLFKRRAAVRLVCQLDNAQRHSSANGGLQSIVYKGGAEEWAPKNWRRWPLQVLGLDQGSDGVCAEHSLRYKPNLRCNMAVYYEISHTYNNDMFLMFKSVGVFDLSLIILTLCNVNQGPDKDEGLRYEEFLDTLKDVTARYPTGQDYPLFAARAGAMLEEMGDEVDGYRGGVHPPLRRPTLHRPRRCRPRR